MKTLQYILLFVTLTSCNKFLEVKPKDSIPDDVAIVDKASAQAALRGVYRGLASDGYYGNSFQSVGYLSGDNIQWTGSQSIVQQFIDHKVKADNATVAAVWVAIYATINKANNVIAKVPELKDATLTVAERDQMIGEARFIRALAYFDLARTWGGVQIVLTPTTSAADKKGIKRSTLAQTYAQVLADLEAAEPLVALPTVQNPVRVNRETVWALRARFHLYQKEWALAESYAAKVISNTTNYQLLKPFNSFFAPASAVATKESVFELSYSATYTSAHRNQWQPPANGGTRQIAPNSAVIALLNDPLIGGTRSTLLAKTSAGLWYANLYYRSPATDPAYLIRIAELYLIRAEARANLEKTIEAKQDLDAVRDRAGLIPSTAATKADLLLAIENERRVEFVFEPHRWYDLIRTGRAGTVLNLTDPKRYVLPIPANELTIDPALEPNDGY
ncbi:RagB/SusD family nutrient uptake outer membrane protein [Chitinophaga niabensis]|uniref:RagB/SusD family nutrient uptake outer membrane protein n=1 Tax=Chitinophaga niabensis TaxID=536979 RepID=UPI0031BBA5E9